MSTRTRDGSIPDLPSFSDPNRGKLVLPVCNCNVLLSWERLHSNKASGPVEVAMERPRSTALPGPTKFGLDLKPVEDLVRLSSLKGISRQRSPSEACDGVEFGGIVLPDIGGAAASRET